jgi:SAM-dependent methyltransferase
VSASNPHPVNSKAYWDERFGSSQGDWDTYAGTEQTAFFGRLALEHTPGAFFDWVRGRGWSLCDWGCALGQATRMLAERLGSEARVEGVDFSPTAIERANELNPGVGFRVADLDALGEYDVIFSSNTLEHFEHPHTILARLSAAARHAVVLLLPFDEREPRHPEHLASFTLESLPMMIGGPKLLTFAKVVDTTGSGYWEGHQILLIYTSPAVTRFSEVSIASLLGHGSLTEAALRPEKDGGPPEDKFRLV